MKTQKNIHPGEVLLEEFLKNTPASLHSLHYRYLQRATYVDFVSTWKENWEL